MLKALVRPADIRRRVRVSAFMIFVVKEGLSEEDLWEGLEMVSIDRGLTVSWRLREAD